MRRERSGLKFIIILLVVISVLIAILIGKIISRRVSDSRENQFASQMSKLSEDLTESDTVSTNIGKSVEDIKSEEGEEDEKFEVPTLNNEENKIKQNEKVENNTNISSKNVDTKNDTAKKTEETNANIAQENKTTDSNTTIETNSEEKKKDEKEEKIQFEAPIKGEILREFAKDSLVFSNTLQEWVTHNGVDIKADKTSVVKAAASGTVSAIKNDPRYGLTVIINHDNGFQTVYSNLLTAEFVVKGEKVEIGQSIGTVGNSASFEISDEYHLHFELLKDNEHLNPVIYINF